jgi:outer-membrane receptor for ferric coprogen and ferric-rhodotorulic acid
VNPKLPGKTILWMFLVAATWTPGLTGAAPGGEPAQYDLKIDRQPLGAALQELARQSGVQIIFFSQIAEGLQAPALKGRYTLTGALQVMLGSSQLTFQVINPKTVAIRVPATNDATVQPDARPAQGRKSEARADTRNDPGKRAAANNADSLDEVVVNGTAEGLVATRTQTPLREIPQTISLISQEQIRQQNDTDLADVLSNAVGITAVQSNSLDKTFISRGFTITTFHLDGGAALNSFSNTPIFGTPDLGEFDHVEVLRGSDALFGGIGNPGATVNIIRKRPLDTSEAQFSAYAGSWNNYRGEADVTGPLGFDGALRARLDIVFGDRDYFFAPASLERKKVFGVLEYDLTARTLLTLGGSYQWNNAVPFIDGLPFYVDGGDARLPRSTALAFNWSRYDTQTREFYAQLQQKLGGVWQLKLNATSLDTATEYGYGAFQSAINPLTKALPVLPFALFSSGPNTQDQFAFDGTLTGSFELFTRRVDVALGGDYTHFTGEVAVEVVNSFEPAVNNVFAFDPAAYPAAPIPTPPPDQSRATTNQSGEFASARVFLAEALSVVGGARISSDRLSNTVSFSLFGLTDSLTQVVKDSGKVTPFGGATYDLNSHYSLYASYADIYQTNNGERKIGGGFLPPADGIDRELGIKGSWRNGTLNGFVVLYGIDQRGLAVFDQNASPADQEAFSPCCYLPNGVNKSKGVDAELSGALTPGWLIGAGYTFNINHDFEGGDLSSETPRHLLKIWSSTQLSGHLQRWTIGGNMQAQSSNFTGDYVCPAPNLQGDCMVPEYIVRDAQGPFVVINLRAGYQISEHWRGALSINNVFDRIYYQTIGFPTGGSWYGEPRGYVLRVDGKY